ncbi:hypothetical protein KR009_003513 [Drosophila setifemur]|nr:hypothetical protein KR009_003513 [Drosophila setifemur]
MFLLLLISVILNYAGAPEPSSIQVIHELNVFFKMELNVFVDFTDFFDYRETIIFPNRDTPKILINSKSGRTDLKLRGNFTERALIIVHLPQPQLDTSVSNLLPYLLDQLHELHIVFLSKEHPASWQEDVFTYCYQQGFINALLIHHQDLYSYMPYPAVQPIRLRSLSEYFNRDKVLANFRGLPIRTLRLDMPPRVFEYLNERNESVGSGYLYFAFKEFTERHNGTLVKIEQPQIAGTELYATIWKMILRKEVDMICYFKQTDWTVPSTVPLSIVPEKFIVPNARPISSYLYYSKPFQGDLWLVVAGTAFYGTLMLYVNSRRKVEIGECLLYSLSHLLFTCNQSITIKGWRDVVIHVILTIGGFMLTNLYLATLSSILTSGLYEPQYNTLEELTKSPYPSLHDSYYQIHMQKNCFLPEILRRKSMALDNYTLLKEYREGLNNSYIYILYEDRADMILMQQYLLKIPRFYKINQPVSHTLESFLTSKSLPFLGMASTFMRRLQEHGIFIKMKADSFRDLIQQGIFTLMRDNEPPAKAFDLEYYFFAFALWALGLSLSLLVFLVEMVKWRYYKKRTQGS